MRKGNRRPDEIRKVSLRTDFISTALGSVLISLGETKVVCTAVIEERVPPFLRGTGKGWVTAEYGMLPASTSTRKPRAGTFGKSDGRAAEIQRLIGRSLRAITNLELLGERTIWVDCDVLQADGGTRVAGITGGYVALVEALRGLAKKEVFVEWPVREAVAAISVGIVDGKALLDLDYGEDVAADVDMNVVMTSSGRMVEIQGTAEQKPFRQVELLKMLKLARKGIRQLFAHQESTLGRGLKP